MVQIENLTFQYSRKRKLFSNLNLEMQSNNIVGLLGKNGSGKTTLLKLIAGLRFAKQGNIKVNDVDPSKRDVDFLSELYYLPEEFDIPNITANEFVKAYSPFYKNFDTTVLKTILNEFQLDSSQKLNQLSYGQKKKFLISFALATKCQLLILDEPTNGLDIPSKAIFRKIVAGALTDNQLVVISTHQVKDIENLLDKIVVLDEGQIVFNKSIFEITEKYAFRQVANLSETHLYNEPSPAGYNVIEAQTNANTNIDIELLFNAIINRKLIDN